MAMKVSRVRVNGQWSCKLGGSGSMVMKVRRVKVNGHVS